MSRRVRETFKIPGSNHTVTFQRNELGRLVHLELAGRVYLEDRDGVRYFDRDFVRASEVKQPRGLLRYVRSPVERWIEEYGWDHHGRPTHIDGTTVQRDARGRVTACDHPTACWRYHYAGDHLATIEGPGGKRCIVHGDDGRPVAIRNDGDAGLIIYDSHDRRIDIEHLPASWQRDEVGRLWTVTDAAGRIQTTFLWDGFACLGRIDGPPGDPLAAVFSLDASNTPVRLIERERVIQAPRDAFGEGLLDHAKTPGLHGGTIWNGFVYLQARTLDPRAGSFDRPRGAHQAAGPGRRSSGRYFYPKATRQS